jgi:enoyl-CoA hydratase
MDTLVSYDLADGVATLTLDDGKVNVLSLPMQSALHHALDRAESDAAAVVLAGRHGVFSAGFDLATLQAQDAKAESMARGGFALAARVLGFPSPVVAACTGHAVAMGALLVSACDFRIGATGAYKLVMNEVAIGISLPPAAIALLRDRLNPSALYRSVALAEVFTPDNAVASGWLDRVVAPEDLVAAAQEHARGLVALNRTAYRSTKLLARQSTLDMLTSYVAADSVLLEIVS